MRRQKTKRVIRKKIRKISSVITPTVRWIARAKSFDVYPHLLIISCLRRNVFFNITNIYGQTKLWTNAGRCGFHGRTKIEYMAVISITETFLIKAWNYGIRRVIVIFKNYSRLHKAVKRAIRGRLKKKKSLQFISYSFHSQITFNGCRAKKKRRR